MVLSSLFFVALTLLWAARILVSPVGRGAMRRASLSGTIRRMQTLHHALGLVGPVLRQPSDCGGRVGGRGDGALAGTASG